MFSKKLVIENFDVDAFGIQSETIYRLEVTITIGVGVGIGTVSVGVSVCTAVSIGVSSVVVGFSISLRLSLALGNLVDNSGSGGGVVSGGSLDDWGSDVVRSVWSIQMWDGVDNGGNRGSGLLLSYGLNNLLGLDLRNGLNSLDGWDNIWIVVVVVHQGVVVGSRDGGSRHGCSNLGIRSNMRLVGDDSVGVVVGGIGFRLSEGHGGKSENYELK